MMRQKKPDLKGLRSGLESRTSSELTVLDQRRASTLLGSRMYAASGGVHHVIWGYDNSGAGSRCFRSSRSLGSRRSRVGRSLSRGAAAAATAARRSRTLATAATMLAEQAVAALATMATRATMATAVATAYDHDSRHSPRHRNLRRHKPGHRCNHSRHNHGDGTSRPTPTFRCRATTARRPRKRSRSRKLTCDSSRILLQVYRNVRVPKQFKNAVVLRSLTLP